MATISEVDKNIYQIETEVRMPHPAIIYFIADKEPALIDTGPYTAILSVMEALPKLGYEPVALSRVFLTHIHMDHAGGVWYLAQQLPHLEVVVHPQGVPHLINPAKLIAGTKEIFGDFEQEFGPLLPVPHEQIRPAQDEEVISLGERALKVIYSPGHAHHHMCFYDTKGGGLFPGEAMGTHLAVTDFILPPVAPPRFDLDSHLETLAKLRKLSPSILFYPHKGAIREVERQFQLAYDGIKICARILSEAAKAGESPGQTMERFYAYVPKEAVLEYELLLESLLTGGMDYSKVRTLLKEFETSALEERDDP